MLMSRSTSAPPVLESESDASLMGRGSAAGFGVIIVIGMIRYGSGPPSVLLERVADESSAGRGDRADQVSFEFDYEEHLLLFRELIASGFFSMTFMEQLH